MSIVAHKRFVPFMAFTAFFAVLAVFVFWGTWGTGIVPVMPDCQTAFPPDYASEWLARWREDGKFIPGDIIAFLGDPYLWVEFQYAAAAYFAALGMAYYCRGRGLSRLAAYGAGLLLAFCGYWFSLFSAGHLGWFQWMTYGVFAFGLADRAVRKGKLKNWILLGACTAWASFRQPDLWLLFTLFTAAYFIWCCARERKLPDWKGMAICAAVFFAIAAPSLRSAAADKANRDSVIAEAKETGSSLTGGNAAGDDAQARWIFVTNWSLPPAEALEFLIPRINGDTSCQMVLAIGEKHGTGVKPYTGAIGRPFGAKSGNYRQHSVYVGFVTCMLCLTAIAALFLESRRRRKAGAAIPDAAHDIREIAFFAICGLVFCALSFGRYFEPAYRLVFMLPIGDSIRAPVKWHHLTEFCICVLAGYGIDAARQFLGRRLAPRTALLATAAIVAFGAWDLARIDRLYCAGHTAGTQIATLQQPVPENPADAMRFYNAIAANGLKTVGTAKMPFRAQNGKIVERNVALIEQKIPRQKPKIPENPLTGLALAIAVVSVLTTFGVAGAAVFLTLKEARK